MPPRAIKHQLTCPFELTSGGFLIGRRDNLVIPRNRLYPRADEVVKIGADSVRPKEVEQSLGIIKWTITQKMADQGWPDLDVAFTIILFATNFFIW